MTDSIKLDPRIEEPIRYTAERLGITTEELLNSFLLGHIGEGLYISGCIDPTEYFNHFRNREALDWYIDYDIKWRDYWHSLTEAEQEELCAEARKHEVDAYDLYWRKVGRHSQGRPYATH